MVIISKAKRILFLGLPLERMSGNSKAQGELVAKLRQDGMTVDHLSAYPNLTEHIFVTANNRNRKFDSLDDFLSMARSEGLKYDILHSHTWAWAHSSLPDGKGIGAVKELFNCGVVHTFHSYIPGEEAAQRDVLDYTDRVINLTPQGEAVFFELFKNMNPNLPEVSVVPNMIMPIECKNQDVEAVRRQISPNGEPLILYVGRFAKEKGTIELAQAFRQIHERYATARLICVGEDTSGMHNKGKMLDNLGDAVKQVTFTGWLSEEEVAVYQRATARNGIQMAPSHTEAFPLSVARAVAVGCPIALSDIPTLRGIYNLNGEMPHAVVIKPTNPNGISKAFDYFQSHRDEVNLRTLNGQREILDKYSPKKVVAMYREIYNKLM